MHPEAVIEAEELLQTNVVPTVGLGVNTPPRHEAALTSAAIFCFTKGPKPFENTIPVLVRWQ